MPNNRTAFSTFALALAAIWLAPAQAIAQDVPPAWAYVVNPPDFKPTPEDGSIRRVPNSSAGFTLTQTRDRFMAIDWHPASHPQMPDIVASGRKPDVYACGFCHRADGPGGPENANLTGLPAAYIIQQLNDIREGRRVSAVPKRSPIELKMHLVKSITDAEIASAAAYFASIPARSIVKVVESDEAPETFVGGWFLADRGNGVKQPLGQRIIEVPETFAHFESRDAHTRFIAYVPKGSIEKGKALATTGENGKTVQCAICHGPELKGVGPIPRIAGLSPSYIVRQLYDFKHGTRAGASSPLMKPSVDNLSVEDMIVLAAYVSSLPLQ